MVILVLWISLSLYKNFFINSEQFSLGINLCIIKRLLCFLAIVLMVFIDIYIAFSAEWKRDLAVSGTGNNPQNTMQYVWHLNQIFVVKPRNSFQKFSMPLKDFNVME